jgi:pyridoxine 5-phosphate synthase
VPERREELTTEGGLDVVSVHERLKSMVEHLHKLGIKISLFIDPEPEQIRAAAALGVEFVELHTGTYANLADRDAENQTSKGRAKLELSEPTRAELEKLNQAAKLARSLGLRPNAGHGLNYRNVMPVAALPGLNWLHIGHAIVARAVMVGMARAVREMKTLIEKAKSQGRTKRLGKLAASTN